MRAARRQQLRKRQAQTLRPARDEHTLHQCTVRTLPRGSHTLRFPSIHMLTMHVATPHSTSAHMTLRERSCARIFAPPHAYLRPDMPPFVYAGGIADVRSCTEPSALLKVARHAPCAHGWHLAPDDASPYARMPPVTVPGAAPCACPGLVPPADLDVVQGTSQPPSVHALTAAWPACGRCGHALLEHGEWILDPHAERVRRTKVAIRLDELLEVRVGLMQDDGKLVDFAYTDVDLDSLRQQMRSLAYVRQAPGKEDEGRRTEEGPRQGASGGAPGNSAPSASSAPSEPSEPPAPSAPTEPSAPSEASAPAAPSKSTAPAAPSNASVPAPSSAPASGPSRNSTSRPPRPPKSQRGKPPAPSTRTPSLPRSVPNADLFHTLNYLYQRAHYLATCAALTNRPHLARWNAVAMRQFFALARRAVIRMYVFVDLSHSDPEIKRSVCKQCMHLLLEGLTAHTTVLGTPHPHPETRRTRLVSTLCLHCRYVRARNVPYPPPAPTRPRHLSQRQRRRRHLWRMHHPEHAPSPPDLAVTPFAERAQGTPWRAPMHAYVQAQHGDVRALEDALTTRGDHITTVGLLRNGQVGPPHDAA